MCEMLAKELENISREANCNVDTKEFAKYLDERDEIKDSRKEFCIPKNKNIPEVDLSLVDGDADSLYFNGNSLGLSPIATEAAMLDEIKKWQTRNRGKARGFQQPDVQFSGSHGRTTGKNPWASMENHHIDVMAELIGAKQIEVAYSSGLTINIHLMMVSFYDPTPGRHKIIIENDAFISDYMAVESQIRFHGFNPDTSLVTMKPREDEKCLRTSDIIETINSEGDETCLVFLGGVNYYTGEKLDMEAITKAAQNKGCKVGFDLAHAVGNVEMRLHDWNVDFACWCSYKYLNSGHGGIGGLFLHEKYAHEKNPSFKKLRGWWSMPLNKRLRMDDHSRSCEIDGARSYVISNLSLFSTIPLFVGLEIFKKYGWRKILCKQRLLTGYLEYLIRKMFHENEVIIYTPSQSEWRGCQLSLAFSKPLNNVAEELSKRGVTFDVRYPDVIRIAPVPLYNTFEDVFYFCKYLRDVLDNVTLPTS